MKHIAFQALASKKLGGSKTRFLWQAMQPRSARGDSKAIVARSAVGGARRAFELDPTLRNFFIIRAFCQIFFNSTNGLVN